MPMSDADHALGRKATLLGMAANFVLVNLKLWVGLAAGSQALVSDAVHSLADMTNDTVVLWGLAMGRRPADQGHPFGHGRLETLAALAVGGGLTAAALFLGHEAVDTILSPIDREISWPAPAAAAVAMLVKEGLFHYTRAVGRRIQSQAVLANAWDHRTDALSSFTVLLGAGAAVANPDWRAVDAYAALVVAGLVLWAGGGVVVRALRELVDSSPGQDICERVMACARSVPGVWGVHDLRMRSAGGRYLMELHVVVDGGLSVERGHAIVKEVERCLVVAVPLAGQITIHLDPGAVPPAPRA